MMSGPLSLHELQVSKLSLVSCPHSS